MSKVPFKISARAAGLIGKENIASAEGAIIELAKNSYDADATKCIIFFDFRDKKNHCLYIIDNGEGMSAKTIDDHWMTIGTSNKLHFPYSENKRIKSGAKGIGRFALDRLGDSVKMFTKQKGENSVLEWTANWQEFTDKKTLDKVFAELDIKENFSLENELKAIAGNFNPFKKLLSKNDFTHGTIFKITGLHDEWDEEALKKLFKNLESLIPPQPNPDFNLFVLCSLYENSFGKIESTFWDDYDYKLEAKVNENGTIKITIDRREFNWKTIRADVFKEKYPKDMSKRPYNLETLKKGTFSYTTTIKEIWPGVNNQISKDVIENIGSFEFDFFYLKRNPKDKDVFSYRNFDTAKRSEWLNRFGGVKIFRDGFKVRPYGEIDSNSFDWLELGRKSSTSAFGPGQKDGINWKVEPQQVYGIVNISRVKNPELKDTTNREGLVESKTFFAFKELLLKLINVIEKDRHYIMRPMRVVYEREEDIAAAKEQAKKQSEEEFEKQSKRKTSSRTQSEKATYAKAVKGFTDEINEKEDEIRMLRSLASIGMTISTFTHELGDIRNFLVSYSKKLKQFIDSEINHKKFVEEKKILKNPFLLSDKIIELITRLNNWIDFANNSIKKDRRKATDLKVYKYFEDLKTRWKEMLDSTSSKLNIDKSLGIGKIKKAYPIDLDSIFNNLLLNSIDAFLRKDSSTTRVINVSSKEEKNGISIIYEDTGPGLAIDIKKPEIIFEPFFTTKKKGEDDIGIGLGMWIVKTTVEQYNGYVEILNSRPGFKIKIYFPKYSK